MTTNRSRRRRRRHPDHDPQLDRTGTPDRWHEEALEHAPGASGTLPRSHAAAIAAQRRPGRPYKTTPKAEEKP